MITVEKAQNTNGVLLKGDFFDLDRLYFAIMKFTGFHGYQKECTFTGCEVVCESLLGLCYELRHAWQGDRDIVQMYNGIHNEWFDDYTECFSHAHYGFDDFEGEENIDDDAYIDGDLPCFSRKDFPDAREHNIYFSILFTFPEIVFYALILSDLLKMKELFFLSRKRLAEETGLMQEIDKEYYLFHAKEDISRMTIFVTQTLYTLYKFIGEERYAGFIGKFDKIENYSCICDITGQNQAIVRYGEKKYEQDDPEILMSTLNSFLL